MFSHWQNIVEIKICSSLPVDFYSVLPLRKHDKL